MKMYFLVVAFVFSVDAFASDSTTVTHKTVEVPIRYFDKDGSPLAPGDIPVIHEMDNTPDGWRFDTGEWEAMKHGWILAPAHYVDPEHGDNGGLAIG